jgi:AraC-like DNA-binding protein
MSHQVGLVLSGEDPDELSAMLSTPATPIKIEPLDGSAISFHCELLSVGEVTFCHCSYEGTILAKREASSGKLLVFLPIQGNAIINYGREEIFSVPGSGTILEGVQDTDGRLYGPRHHLALSIDQSKITKHLTNMLERPVNGVIDINPHISLTTGPGLMLKQLAKKACDGLRQDAPLRQSPLGLAALCDAMTYLILETCPNRYSNDLARPAPMPAPRHVKWAIDFMHERIADPISLDDIAAAARVSVRTLQLGFRQFRETTPMSYLHELRLIAAHQDLQDSQSRQSVANVALKWGFTHLGRFAAEYKKRFGHLPSQTTKR